MSKKIGYVVAKSELGGHKLPKFWLVLPNVKNARKAARERTETSGETYLGLTVQEWREECEKYWNRVGL